VPYEVGDLIDNHYRVERRYTGGMGYVYLVMDEVVNKRYAIKQLLDSHARIPVLRERFRREAAVWIQLGYHPNIVQAHTYHETKDGPVLILEYVDGPSLQELLRLERRLAQSQAIAYARQVCHAMDWAHSREIAGFGKGVLHRDIKPSNILITRTNNAKLTDFGLAKVFGDTRITKKDQFLGTAAYSSPEQLQAASEVTAASDIYSIGAVLYHMLCGVPPFRGKTHPELFYKIQYEAPASPHEICAEIHPEVSQVVLKCLEKNPGNRYQTFAELERALATLESLVLNPADWRCRACGYASLHRHERCPVCSSGTLAKKGAWRCSCGTLVEPGLMECPSCGRLVPIFDDNPETTGSSVVPQDTSEDVGEETLALTATWDVPVDRPALLVVHPGGLYRVVPIEKSRFSIGSHKSMKLVLPDPAVSRDHLLLVRLPCGWTAIARRPRNLPVFNGWPLLQRHLRSLDVVKLGNTYLVFWNPVEARIRPLQLLPGKWQSAVPVETIPLVAGVEEADWADGPPATCEVRAPEREPVRSSGAPLRIGSAPVAEVSVRGTGVALFHVVCYWKEDGLHVRQLHEGLRLRINGQDASHAVLTSAASLDVGVVPIQVTLKGDPTAPGRHFANTVARRDRRLALTVVSGDQKGQTAVLQEGHIYHLGRDPSADLVVVSDTYTSRRHLKLVPRSNSLLISDCGSRNGFFVNRVHHRDSATARPGDLLLVGRTSFLVHYELVPEPW